MGAGAPGRYPPQVKYIVASEACERVSFHGTRALLTAYMSGTLAYPDVEAKAWYHGFLMLAALAPFLGARLADRSWGRHRTILWVLLCYLAGLAALAAWGSATGLAAGLLLVTAGTGGLKPCLPAYLGDQLRPAQQVLAERIHGRFYWAFNLGVAAAVLLLPWLLARRGPAIAFAVPGVLMALATLAFWAGTRRAVRRPPAPPDPHRFLRVAWHGVKRLGTHRAGEHWLEPARAHHPVAAVEGAKAVFRVAGVFAAVTAFWALFDQTGSAWVLQGRQLVQRLDLGLLGLGTVELEAAQLQALNPLLVVALVPLGAWLVFPALERRGLALTPLKKMAAGLFVTVLSFASAAVVQQLVDSGRPPHLLWQVPQYLLLTTGEVLVSVTGLEFASRQAPRAMRPTILSIWSFTVFLGNLLAFLAQFAGLSGGAYYWCFAALMLAAAVGFARAAGRYGPAASAEPEASGATP